VLQELLAWVKKLNDKLSVHQSPSEQETDTEVTMAMIYLEWSLKVSIWCMVSHSLTLNTVVRGQDRQKNNSKNKNRISEIFFFQKQVFYMVKKRILKNFL
jgi:hypothetical protein